MTVPVDDPDVLRRVLAGTEALLLDFDGPTCNVFAGFPATTVADQLRDILTDGGHRLPDRVRDAADPFYVLRYAATLGDDEARYVEAAFTAHEVDAIRTAEPTPGAHDLIETWTATGRQLAIVSNNSHAAVTTYLNLYDLRDQVHHISARINADVTRLKPSPYLLTQAARALATPPARCTIIGDAVTDIQAAHAAGTNAIGYANKPGKAVRLAAAQPAAIAETMALLVLPVRVL